MQDLTDAYLAVRAHTEALCADLTEADQCVQSMPDASPAKWHRAHTTWFFEEFVLAAHLPGYRRFDPRFGFLFNSYYEAVGPRHPRPARGLLTRPSAGEISAYRAHVDAAMAPLLAAPLLATPHAAAELIALGLQHEQQHQELLITDQTHAFAQSPLLPAMLPGWRDRAGAGEGWLACPGGEVWIGTEAGFAFDNETPRHRQYVAGFEIARGLVRNADFAGFIADGGYRRPELWMSDGWAKVAAEGWEAPLYWQRDGDGWAQFGPGGLAALMADAPVRQISWYEADAFARWAGARLPTEAEWEIAAGIEGFADADGQVWQWTNSAYLPYPGFAAAAGAVGEYNGKFMIGQMVLRGGSRATPAGHARRGYRNFFHPEKRWQFSGLRLAR